MSRVKVYTRSMTLLCTVPQKALSRNVLFQGFMARLHEETAAQPDRFRQPAAKDSRPREFEHPVFEVPGAHTPSKVCFVEKPHAVHWDSTAYILRTWG